MHDGKFLKSVSQTVSVTVSCRMRHVVVAAPWIVAVVASISSATSPDIPTREELTQFASLITKSIASNTNSSGCSNRDQYRQK